MKHRRGGTREHASTWLQRIRLLALVLVSAASASDAQSLKVSATGGVVVLVSSEGEAGIMQRDRFTRPVGKMGYGFGPLAAAVGAEVKYSPRNPHITLAAGVSYTPLSGGGPPEWIDENPFTIVRIDTKAQLWTISLGGQWEILHGPLRPYIGARVLFSYMPDVEVRNTLSSGQTVIDDQGRPSGVWVYRAEGIHRVGFGFLAGGELDIFPRIGLDLSARYHFTNLFQEAGQGYGSYFNSCTVALGVSYEVLQ